MSIASSYGFVRTREDLFRIENRLADLQRQISSGYKEETLAGYGAASTRLLSARTLIEQAEARAQQGRELQPRLAVQDAALGLAASSTLGLIQSIENALANNDGILVAEALGQRFEEIASALNQSDNGTYLFAGERTGEAPITVDTIEELAGLTTVAEAFRNGDRSQRLSLGDGAEVIVGPLASDIATGLFETLREFKRLINSEGGSLASPLTGAQRDTLLATLDALKGERTTLLSAQARNGNVQARIEAHIDKQENRAQLFTKVLGETADADLAEVSTELTAVQSQYEAVASVFATLRELTLLNYLR